MEIEEVIANTGDHSLCPFCHIEYDRQMDELRVELMREGKLSRRLVLETRLCYTAPGPVRGDIPRVVHLPTPK